MFEGRRVKPTLHTPLKGVVSLKQKKKIPGTHKDTLN